MDQKVYFEHGGVQLLAPILPEFGRVLTPEALEVVGQLTRALRPGWRELLAERQAYQLRVDTGERPDYNLRTKNIRESEWSVAPIPEYLSDRKVENVCPASSEKMLVYGLNAKRDGATVALACLEDANGCQWGPGGTVHGLNNLYDAARGTLSFEHPQKGTVRMEKDSGALMMRPRGLHFTEPRMLVDGEETPAIIFDVGLHLFHNGIVLFRRGRGADLYLAKLETGAEAEWCNDLVDFAEAYSGIPGSSAKVSVLFEHIKGVLNREEIIYALRRRFVAGNTGWLDYLASLSRVMRADGSYVMPDPGQVNVTVPCMKAYLDAVVQSCHRRGALAIGGTATQLAVPGNEVATGKARADVRDNAQPYAEQGFDGGWVVYAPFVPIVHQVFAQAIGDRPNQMDAVHNDAAVTAEQLLEPPPGTVTLDGLDECVEGGVTYIAEWLAGTGAVPITYHRADGTLKCRLMEDAATGQRKREDVWKWLRTGRFTVRTVQERLARFMDAKSREMGSDAFIASTYPEAGRIFISHVTSPEPPVEYFPPELLEHIWADERRTFASSAR